MEFDLPFEFVFTVILDDTKKLIKARNYNSLKEKCRINFKFAPDDEIIIFDYLTKIQIDEDVFVAYILQSQNIQGFSIGVLVLKNDSIDLTMEINECELSEEVLPVIL